MPNSGATCILGQQPMCHTVYQWEGVLMAQPGAPNPRALGTQTSAIRAFCYFLNFIKFIGLTLVSKLT